MIDKFTKKLNKVDGKTYVIEEVINLVDGVYDSELSHDNVNRNTINIYTGSKLTGKKVTSYTVTIPSVTPWKTLVKIFSSEPTLYISYETPGDTVEADDINTLQNAIAAIQKDIERYKIEGHVDGGTF